MKLLLALALVVTGTPALAEPCSRRLAADGETRAVAVGRLPTGELIAVGTGTGPKQKTADLWWRGLEPETPPQWVTRAGGDGAASLLVVPSGEVWIGGHTDVKGTHSLDPLLVRVAKDGTVLEQRTWRGNGYGSVQAMAARPDGSVALALTRSHKKGGMSADAWLIGLDPSGKQSWELSFNGEEYDALTEVVATADGFLAIGDSATASKGFSDGWAVSFSADGAQRWEQRFGGESGDYFNRVVATPAGFTIVGSYGRGDNKSDLWLVQLDPSGEVLSDRVYDEPFSQRMPHLVPAADGVLWVIGDLLGDRVPGVFTMRVDASGACTRQ